MFTIRRPPHGSIYVYEALEVKLIMSAYDADLTVIYLDDGVFAVKKGQDTSALGIKEYEPTCKALVDYDVSRVFVDRRSMEERGMNEQDLLSIGVDEESGEPIRPQVIDSETIMTMMAEQHNILSF